MSNIQAFSTVKTQKNHEKALNSSFPSNEINKIIDQKIK